MLNDGYVVGYKDIDSFIVDTAAQNVTEYIPGNSRNNWNGILSPDGTKIAFMSAPRGIYSPAYFPETDIYIIPIEGGDPVKVTGHSFSLGREAYAEHTKTCVLIDWI